MGKLSTKDVIRYVEENIGVFHSKRLEKLEKLSFNDVLKRKNPYLFRAKDVSTAQDLVKQLLDAYLQSQEETLFGEFLEGLAIFVCAKVFKGFKSTILEGIDLEFEKNGIYYIVEIKSGTNWGNSSQLKRMKENFENAKRVLLDLKPKLKIVAVNGCCYGVDKQPDKGDYYKICGQEFWELISDSKTLYMEIIEPIGHKAREKNDAFYKSYAKVINKFTLSFSQEFCKDGEIDWEKIVKLTSSLEKD